MRNFIVQIERNPRKSGHVKVTLHRITKNTPVYLGVYESFFESDGQATYNAAVELKALPEKILQRYNGTFAMHEAGIAEFHQL